MKQEYHTNATTNVKQRMEIKALKRDKTLKEIANDYRISTKTVKKWTTRKVFTDALSRPHNINYSYSNLQENLVVSIRKLTWESKENVADILLQKEMNIPSSTVYNIFKKHLINKKPRAVREKQKTFKEYDPGFIHIDVTYLPKIEGKRNYLYVAIDRATRLLYYKLYNSKSSNNAVDFLENVNNIFPMKIDIILTDNGFEFTNKHIKSKRGEYCKKEAKFTEKCIEKSIEHRTTFAISSTNQWDGGES